MAKSAPPIQPMYPMMVHEYYVGLMREMRRKRAARLNALKTRKAALTYQDHVRETIAEAFSPWPARTPLNARVTGETEIAHSRIENVLFESRPGCFVTGNFYMPHGIDRNRRAPAVIADCGHSANGKQAIPYQNFAQRLAAAGFITFLIEPFNQGERDQYAKLPKSLCADLRDNCCNAHNMMGKQLELVGEFFGMWRAWDVMRALDYLLARPEVDPRHVGMTGNSGGGTMTAWTFAIDTRITMAAPGCFITTFAHNLENHLPSDCEQYPPGVLKHGLEMADFIIARAPAPAIILGQTFDFFDRRGLPEACADIRRIHNLLGAPPRNFKLFVGPAGHGYSHHNQQQMVEFFVRHAGVRGKVKKLTDKQCVDLGEKLLVTPIKIGNVVKFGATPIYEQIAKIARIQIVARKKPKPLSPKLLATSVRLLFGIAPEIGSGLGAVHPPHFRVLRPHTFKNYRAARFAIETEISDSPHDPRSVIRAFMQKPVGSDAKIGRFSSHGHSLDVETRVTLYLPHVRSETELNDPKLAGGLIGKTPLYALDVRGLGESMPIEPSASDFFEPYGYDYMFHGHGLMFGESYLGRRVFDVLRTIDLLVSLGAKTVDLAGRGQGAILAAFAGLLAANTGRVTLRNAPRNFADWATNPVVRWPAANFIRGGLEQFDFDDVVRALGRRVKVTEPWGVEMK